MPSRPSNASPHTSQPASRLNSSQTARRMSGLSSTTKIAFVMGKPSFCEASKYDESADLRCRFRFMVFRGNLNLEGEIQFSLKEPDAERGQAVFGVMARRTSYYRCSYSSCICSLLFTRTRRNGLSNGARIE